MPSPLTSTPGTCCPIPKKTGKRQPGYRPPLVCVEVPLNGVDAHFLNGNYAAALSALEQAMRCPDAIGNPFIHLRLGQTQFELGNKDRAADELMRAYMGAGAEIFAEEAPKYLEFLGTVAEGIESPRPLQ